MFPCILCYLMPERDEMKWSDWLDQLEPLWPTFSTRGYSRDAMLAAVLNEELKTILWLVMTEEDDDDPPPDPEPWKKR